MLPYQKTIAAMDYAVSSSFQRQAAAAAAASSSNLGVGLGMNINPAFAHSWFVPADLCVPYKQNQNPLLEPGILELRKEKSRDAARSRRGKENFEFYELAKLLPLPAAITSQLDKASIIRLTISYLKLRQFSESGDPIWNRTASITNKGSIRNRTSSSLSTDIFEDHQGTHILQSLDGFALALAADGRFLYISETVSIYLGLSQVEMTGSSVFDYIHAEDHNELAEHLGLGLAMNSNLASPNSNTSEDGTSGTMGTHNPDVSTLMSLSNNSSFVGYDRAFCIRMKSTLTKRGCHFKTSGFRVVLILCKLRPEYPFTSSRKTNIPLLGMVGLAIALPPPSVHEMRLDSDMFVTRINFDFKIAHCEPRVPSILDYSSEELVGKSLYSLCHGEDVNKLRKCHIDLIKKGQVLTHYYRLMNKYGGYTWIQTCATVVCNSKNAEEQTIICVNYLISSKEYKNVVMDCCQLHDSDNSIKMEQTSVNDQGNRSPDKDSNDGNNNSSASNHTRDNNNDNITLNKVTNNSNNNQSSIDSDEILRSQDNSSKKQTKNNDLVVQPLNSTNNSSSSSNSSSISPSSSLSSSPISVASSSLPSIVDKLINNESDNKSPLIVDSNKLNKNTNTNTNTNTNGKRKFFKIVDDEASNSDDFFKKKNILNCDNNKGNDSNNNNSNQAMKNGKTTDNDTTTVKDLENAMSKHLPNELSKRSTESNLIQQTTTDFSTDALLKQQDKATIQWIGGHQHQHSNHHNNQQQQQHHNHNHHQHQHHHQQQQQHHHHHHQQQHHNSATNTASALLRQLYANRESVIRANVQGNCGNSVNIRSSIPPSASSAYFINDQHGPLPTPPDSDTTTNNSNSSYHENQFMLHHHHHHHHHHQKSLAAAATVNDTFNALISYSTPSTYAAAAVAAAAVDYHSAMTPPASVSPRDKNQLLHNNVPSFENSVYNDVLRHSYFSSNNPTNGSTVAVAAAAAAAAAAVSATTPVTSSSTTTASIENSSTLPLKSQLYTAASAVHSNAFDAAATAAAVYAAAGSIEQSQFYHHNSARSTFHHFYKSNAPTTNWYSP